MRHETQVWDRVRATTEIVTAGAGLTGKTVTVAVQRLSDGLWLQAGGGSWGASFATNTMSEPDVTNLPGLYQYAIPGAQLAHDTGLEGYIFRISEATVPLLEHVKVDITRRSAWDDLQADHTTANSYGEGVFIANDGGAAGSKNAADLVDDTWNEVLTPHSVPLSASVYLKDTASLPDANAIADQVWEENINDHLGGTKTGETLNNASGLSASATAAAVWNAAAASYNAAGSMGEAMNNAGGGVSLADIADAVWDEPLLGHADPTQFGGLVHIIGSLVHFNHRMKNPVYDLNGRLASAELVAYPSAADADSDINAIATVELAMTYDTEGNLDTVLGKKQ